MCKAGFAGDDAPRAVSIATFLELDFHKRDFGPRVARKPCSTC
jgi:hypothetical protein